MTTSKEGKTLRIKDQYYDLGDPKKDEIEIRKSERC